MAHILVLSHFYPPDPASVGQHSADAAAEMAARGYRVTVISSDRDFEDPRRRYPRYVRREGVDVHRVPWSSFGKRTIFLRALGMGMFMLHCLWAVLSRRDVDAILVSTSPPLCGVAATLANVLRGTPFLYWVMDLNPDQLIVLGKIGEHSMTARISNLIQRMVLRRAGVVIPLDRFMEQRLLRKAEFRGRSRIIPPWPHERPAPSLAHADNWFRDEHQLQDKFVIMYSGNHGLSTPVETMLDAARQLEDEPRIQFLFVGGGVRKVLIDEAIARDAPPNVRSLPYQPQEHLRYSLSAADLHLVSMEENVVGIVHPCKIYGAMTMGRPIVLLGPRPCHASEILESESIGWQVGTDDAAGMAAAIREALAMDSEQIAEVGARAKELADRRYSLDALCGEFCDRLEGLLAPAILSGHALDHPTR